MSRQSKFRESTLFKFTSPFARTQRSAEVETTLTHSHNWSSTTLVPSQDAIATPPVSRREVGLEISSPRRRSFMSFFQKPRHQSTTLPSNNSNVDSTSLSLANDAAAQSSILPIEHRPIPTQEPEYHTLESTDRIGKENLNHPQPSALTDWKNINVASLNSLLTSRQGFEIVVKINGNDAITVMDFINNTLKSSQLTDRQRRRYSVALRKLCGNCRTLPTSHTLTQGLEKVGELPITGNRYSDVWEGRYKGQPVVIKAFRLYREDEFSQVKKRICKEAVKWIRLSHPNVVPFLGVATSPFQFCIASPWMPHGNLNEYVNSHPQADKFALFRDLVNGLSYLHSMGVVHGNLKGTNIMINEDERLCLTDFGLAEIVSDIGRGFTTAHGDTAGSIRWMAPEQFFPENYGLEDTTPSKESDVYAFGMVVYEIATGRIPFSNARNDVSIIRQVLSGVRPDRPTDPTTINFVDAVWPVAEECWRNDRKERPNISQILERLKLDQPPTIAPSSKDVSKDSGTLRTKTTSECSEKTAIEDVFSTLDNKFELSEVKCESSTVSTTDRKTIKGNPIAKLVASDDLHSSGFLCCVCQ